MKGFSVRLTSLWLLLAAVAALSMKHWPTHVAPPAPSPTWRHSPVTVPVGLWSVPRLLPNRVKRPPKALHAAVGETLSVSITAYCLRSPTRLDHAPHEGIVAADPRVFTLGRDIDLVLEGRPLGRFRVDDTGLLIKGRFVDIWLPDCGAARRFGRKRGFAILAAKDSAASGK